MKNVRPDVVPRGRGPMRRAALLHELSFVYSMGQYEIPGGSRDYSPPHWIPVGKREPNPSDEVEAELMVWTLHDELVEEAVPRYMEFRRSIDEVTQRTADTLICWTGRTSNVDEATRWISLGKEEPLHPEFNTLTSALADLRNELVKWKLAPETGEAPLLNPFAAALAVSLEQAKLRYRMDKPFELTVVPGLGGGTFLQGLAYYRLCSMHCQPLPRKTIKAIGLDINRPGSGLPGQYQIKDAQWWILIRIGEITLTKVARTVNKTRQEIQKSLKNTERALKGE